MDSSEEKEDVKDRIRLIMERENLTAGAFAESIGVAQATISQILRGRNKYPSTDVVLRLHQRYPDISLEWLLTGHGTLGENAETEVFPSVVSDYPLFAENAPELPEKADYPENRKDLAFENAPSAPKEVVRQEIVYKERPPRKITEIRIFFDDNTYETFRPEK